MAPYDINESARRAVRDSDFETMMWYAYYVITDNQPTEEEKDTFKQAVVNIIKGSVYYGFDYKKIYEFPLSYFALIMDYVHKRFANNRDDFLKYSGLFKKCLEALMENDLIDSNPMVQLMDDPGYLGKYWRD